jgi:SPP1 Gp6-like portal protein
LLDLAPDEWLPRLVKLHDAELFDLNANDHYYEGTQPLSYMAPELLRELNERMRQLVINWPRLVVDALEERLDVEGFRWARQARADDDLWEIWQANDLDEESQLAHVDALALRRSFVIVGANEDDEAHPLITVESPIEVYADRDPRTREVCAAVKRWSEDVPAGGDPVEHATLYLPDLTTWYVKVKGKWVSDPDQDPDHHGLGRVPVVPLVNRARTRNRAGVSELKDVIPVSDSLCKIATDMMVSAEYHAIPRRYAAGLSQEDFVDPDGNRISSYTARIGALWLSENPETKFGQFPEAQLSNFHETVNCLARIVSGLTGLPPHFLGYIGGEPISADAIRASEARLIKRAERRQRAFGGSWERVMRLALLIRDNREPEGAASLETIWRDAATPTRAQQADAAVKLHGEGLLPTEQAWEDLGYTQVQIDRMLEMQARATDRALGPEYSALIGAQRPAPMAAEPAAEGAPAAMPPAPAAA